MKINITTTMKALVICMPFVGPLVSAADSTRDTVPLSASAQATELQLSLLLN